MVSQVRCQVDSLPTLYAGYVASINHDPSGWSFPTETAAFIRFRLEQLSAELVADAADWGMAA